MTNPVQKRGRKLSEDETLLALLREYTEKFNDFAEISPCNGKQETLPPQVLENVVSSLIRPAMELARHVSQRIEHAGLEPLVRLEMKLRLAEFEGAMHAAQDVAQDKLQKAS